MGADVSPWELANTVSALATVLSGALAFAMGIIDAHPRRWQFAYACLFITGTATVWFHGFGETFYAGAADIGTNLLLAWALQVAVLGDYYPAIARRYMGLLSGAINGAFIAGKLIVGPGRGDSYPLSFGDFGGFKAGELLLILDSLLVAALLYAQRGRMARPARSYLGLTLALFIAGLLLATASNARVDFRVMAWHAAWHIVGAFGFIAMWMFNHARFRGEYSVDRKD